MAKAICAMRPASEYERSVVTPENVLAEEPLKVSIAAPVLVNAPAPLITPLMAKSPAPIAVAR